MTDLETIEKQHLNTYKNAVKEIIYNNTKSLVEGDIISLIKKPPLDSMDTIKMKLLSLAKKENQILNTKELEILISDYRENLSNSLMDLTKMRIDELINIIDKFEPKRETETISIQEKDIELLNKNIKKEIKKILDFTQENYLFSRLDKLFVNSISQKSQKNIINNFEKYMKSTYIKQLLENIAIKILVKDRTLMNGIFEQGERYLFTKSNSHLFDKEFQNATN